MGRSTDSVGREAAVGDGLSGQFRVVDHGEHDALGAQIECLLGPGGARLGKAEDGRGAGGGEGVETRESVGDAAMAVLHVDDDEVVAGEASDLGEGR